MLHATDVTREKHIQASPMIESVTERQQRESARTQQLSGSASVPPRVFETHRHQRAIYAEHLQTLKERFERYFPRAADIEDNDRIRDPFNQESESSKEKLTMKEREESAELRADRTLKLTFSELTLDQAHVSH
ncbi:unnamed protein product [Arctogadus glacialis]